MSLSVNFTVAGVDCLNLGDDAVGVEASELVGVVLERLFVGDLGSVQGVLGVHPVVEAEDNCVSIEVGAVLELDALAQGKGPGLAVFR